MVKKMAEAEKRGYEVTRILWLMWNNPEYPQFEKNNCLVIIIN